MYQANDRAMIDLGERTSVLYLTDPAEDRQVVQSALIADGRFDLKAACCPAEFAHWLGKSECDLVVSGLANWGMAELEVLDQVRTCGHERPVVIITSCGSEAWAVAAMQRGAADYISMKTPAALSCLADRLRGALTRWRRAAQEQEAARRATAGREQLYTHCLRLLCIAGFDGYMKQTNPAWDTILGYTREEMLASPVRELVHPDDRAQMALAREQMMLGQCAQNIELRVRCKDGSYKWILWNGAPCISEGVYFITAHDVTQRKAVEAQLRESQERFLRVASATDDSVWDWDLRTGQMWCNERCAQSFGRIDDAPDGVFQWWLDRIHPDDRPRIMASIPEPIIDSRRQWTNEYRLRRLDGTYAHVYDRGFVIFGADGEPVRMVGSAMDISALKNTQAELRDSQERLQLIASASKEAIWDWDVRTGTVWRNETYIQTFGGSDRSQDLTQWWGGRLHPDDRDRVVNAVCNMAAKDHQWTIEYRLRRLDNSYVHVYDRGFVHCDSQGNPIRMVGSLIDVSDLKQAEQKLQESNERFRLVAKATRDAIWDWDLRTGQVWRSEGYRALFGYDPQNESDNASWWTERIHTDDRQRVLAQFSLPGLATVQERGCEYRFLRADGTYADVFDRGFVMSDSDGRAVRMIGSVVDISERLRAQQLFHMHQVELAHSARVRTIGEIAAGVAHELNQPLTAIANYAESCARAIGADHVAPGSKVLTWLDQIVNNTQRAGDMIRRLRGFARKSEPRRSHVEINEVVQEVIELLEPEARLHDIRVHWQPLGTTAAVVDRIQLEQVLVNLLRNAFEAMSDNPPEDRHVKITVVSTGARIEVAVEDQGGGILPEHHDRVFEPFFTTKSTGVGIGLTICRSIVEDHGGRMWVESSRPRGAMFCFTLPLGSASNVAVSNGLDRR